MRFGGIVIAVALVVGACSGEPVPQEPDPAPTPTSTATLPAMPEQATEDSPEGAAAFVDHWVDVFNYASQTGDVDELSRLSSPGCEGCQKYIDLYRDTYEAGGYFRGGEWHLSDVTVEGAPEGVRVFGHIAADAGTQRDSDGATGTTNPEDNNLLFTIYPAAQGTWTLVAFEQAGS